ncbi:hypothetical protein PR048_008787 [Dryococelus australis]|uniref:Uncharacterized protein n=1 Tax=Dryococelus australis TaxID=614101 RepID=A0ABQ9HY43_9NEOP|nr:hypothetical protein PR048_008787 [Dryococelus australis]
MRSKLRRGKQINPRRCTSQQVFAFRRPRREGARAKGEHARPSAVLLSVRSGHWTGVLTVLSQTYPFSNWLREARGTGHASEWLLHSEKGTLCCRRLNYRALIGERRYNMLLCSDSVLLARNTYIISSGKAHVRWAGLLVCKYGRRGAAVAREKLGCLPSLVRHLDQVTPASEQPNVGTKRLVLRSQRGFSTAAPRDSDKFMGAEVEGIITQVIKVGLSRGQVRAAHCTRKTHHFAPIRTPTVSNLYYDLRASIRTPISQMDPKGLAVTRPGIQVPITHADRCTRCGNLPAKWHGGSKRSTAYSGNGPYLRTIGYCMLREVSYWLGRRLTSGLPGADWRTAFQLFDGQVMACTAGILKVATVPHAQGHLFFAKIFQDKFVPTQLSSEPLSLLERLNCYASYLSARESRKIMDISSELVHTYKATVANKSVFRPANEYRNTVLNVSELVSEEILAALKSEVLRADEAGDPRENPPTSDIVWHDSHIRNPGVTPLGIKPGSPGWEGSSLTTTPPRPLLIVLGDSRSLRHEDVTEFIVIPRAPVLSSRRSGKLSAHSWTQTLRPSMREFRRPSASYGFTARRFVFQIYPAPRTNISLPLIPDDTGLELLHLVMLCSRGLESDEDEMRREWSSAKMLGQGKREIPKKTADQRHQPSSNHSSRRKEQAIGHSEGELLLLVKIVFHFVCQPLMDVNSTHNTLEFSLLQKNNAELCTSLLITRATSISRSHSEASHAPSNSEALAANSIREVLDAPPITYATVLTQHLGRATTSPKRNVSVGAEVPPPSLITAEVQSGGSPDPCEDPITTHSDPRPRVEERRCFFLRPGFVSVTHARRPCLPADTTPAYEGRLPTRESSDPSHVSRAARLVATLRRRRRHNYGATYARLDHRVSSLDPRSDLRSTQKTVAPFEFRVELEIEMKFISNCRNWRFEISIPDQQPSATNQNLARSLLSISHFGTKIDESEIQNHKISLMQCFYIGTKIKLDPGSEQRSFDLGSGKMLVQPSISKGVHIEMRDSRLYRVTSSCARQQNGVTAQQHLESAVRPLNCQLVTQPVRNHLQDVDVSQSETQGPTTACSIVRLATLGQLPSKRPAASPVLPVVPEFWYVYQIFYLDTRYQIFIILEFMAHGTKILFPLSDNTALVRHSHYVFRVHGVDHSGISRTFAVGAEIGPGRGLCDERRKTNGTGVNRRNTNGTGVK